MKKNIFLLVILLAFTLPVIHAQQFNNQEFLQAKVQKFSKMQKTGIVMTAVGGISVISGIVLLSNAEWTKTSDGNGNVNYNSQDSNAIIGILLTGVGVGLTGAGIPLTIIGNKKSQKYKKLLNELTVIPYYNSNHAGLNLSFRF